MTNKKIDKNKVEGTSVTTLNPTAPSLLEPVPAGPIPLGPTPAVRKNINLTIDGKELTVQEGDTLLDACRLMEIDIPTLCFLDNFKPVNVCRVCVVELKNSRTLVPACSRLAENGMVVQTNSERVKLSRRLVLEFLASSVDISTAPELQGYLESYEGKPMRFGHSKPLLNSQKSNSRGLNNRAFPESHVPATNSQPVKIDNELYVRDYSKCILCYKCVQACGDEAQNTFAITVAGRGFDSCISTEYSVPLPDSACVYCGNCIGVCPTGALMFKTEFDLRKADIWDESVQDQTDTICPYCGVGCTVTLHVQDNSIVKVTSPFDQEVTEGHLCIKGRFGWQFLQQKKKKETS